MRRIASRITLTGLLVLAAFMSAGCYKSVSFGFHDGYRGHRNVSYGYYGHGYHRHHHGHGGHGHYNYYCD